MSTLQKILTRARSSHADERQMAAYELEDQPLIGPVRSTLLELLADPDWRVRRATIDSVMNSGKTELIPEMLQALYEEANAGKRNAALAILSRSGREILPHLGPHLSTSNPDVRMFLVNLLGDLRDGTHLSFITECLHQPEQNLVSAAISAIGKIADPSSVPLLIELLHGENLWYQFQAIEAAGDMQDEALLPHLIPFLDSPYCRAAVLKGLGKFHHPEAYRVLVGSLVKNDRIDSVALDSILQILRAPQPEVIQEKDRAMIRDLCEEHLAKTELPAELKECMQPFLPPESDGKEKELQTDDSTVLLHEIKHEDPVVRHRAIQRMANEVRPEFSEPLMAALADEDSRARELAAVALDAYASQEVTDALLSTLLDDDVWVRVAIYNSLDARDPRILKILKENLQHENPICKATILRRLGNSGDTSVTEILVSHLNHADPELRASACEGLSRFDSDALKQTLLDRLEQDPSWSVRLAALRSLNQIRPSGFQRTLLERLHKDEDASVRNEILHILLQLKAGELPEIVFDFLRDPLLADSAAQYLVGCSSEKQQILKQAASCVPAVRRIVQRLLE